MDLGVIGISLFIRSGVTCIPRVGEANTDGALLVGAVDARSVVFEHLHGFGAGMSVLVIGSHADKCDFGESSVSCSSVRPPLLPWWATLRKSISPTCDTTRSSASLSASPVSSPRASALPSPSASNSSNPTRLSSFSLVPPSCGAMMLRENRPARKVVIRGARPRLRVRSSPSVRIREPSP